MCFMGIFCWGVIVENSAEVVAEIVVSELREGFLGVFVLFFWERGSFGGNFQAGARKHTLAMKREASCLF